MQSVAINHGKSALGAGSLRVGVGLAAFSLQGTAVALFGIEYYRHNGSEHGTSCTYGIDSRAI